MNRLLCLSIIIFLVQISFAQSYTTKANASGKAKKMYDRGLQYSSQGENEKALKDFMAALKDAPDFIDAQLYLAGTLANLDRMEESEMAFEKGIAIDPDYSAKAHFSLAALEQKLEKYQESIEHYQQYIDHSKANEVLKEKARRRIPICQFSMTAANQTVPFEPKNLGELINTPDPEYLPSLTADGQTMVYTRVVRGQEDFYISIKKNEVWLAGQALEMLNTPMNEGAQNISADGKFLVFTACAREDGLGSCDLYFSEVRDGRWTPPANMGSPVNSRDWESQPSLTADGKTLYFTSKRLNGKGGADIWVSYRGANGKWSTPENIGEAINSEGDDQSPFIHPDGQTLYFMSNGHPGMGGFDLYLSRMQENGTWSTPKNLGYPINTKGNEGALIVSLDGTTGYFATGSIGEERDGKASLMDKMKQIRNQDLYSFSLYPEIRPQPVTYVKAKVFDLNTHKELSATIEFIDLATEKIYASSLTDKEGEFLIVLPLGKDYALNVSKKGYFFHSENFSLTGRTTDEEAFLLEIGLQAIPVDPEDSPTEIATVSQPIILRNVFFDTGSATLRPASFLELNKLLALLEENASLHIQINGHTDNVGSEADNLILSENRAKAVHDFLIEKGISQGRLSYKGFGENQPIDTNDTAEGQQSNRRTEFVVIK